MAKQKREKKVTLTCTAPDGTIISRTTDNLYTHVLITDTRGGWGAVQWCSRLDLAQKALRRYSSWNLTNLTIVQVNLVDGEEENGLS